MTTLSDAGCNREKYLTASGALREIYALEGLDPQPSNPIPVNTLVIMFIKWLLVTFKYARFTCHADLKV